MQLALGIDKKLGICDIETMAGLFDIGVYDPDTKEWLEFEVSAYKNQLYEFVKWYTSSPCDYMVTFNGINFDQQVLEYIVENYEKWYDLGNQEVVDKIYNFAQKLIDDQNYGLFLPYKEWKFQIPPIDVFRIFHFDNDARRTSLKWCEFMMNMDVEEMPIHHSKKDLTQEEIEEIKAYRRHDVHATLGVLYMALGEVDKIKEINGGWDLPELKDYKGKNAIETRLQYIKETGMPCLNWSDVKIGEEWNKKEYMKSQRIVDEKLIYPTKVVYPYGRKFKNFFPKTMKFKTDKLKNFIKELGEKYVTSEKQEFPILLGDTVYTIAKGGIHSTEKNRKLQIPHGWTAKDADVGAQYPQACIKLEIYPPHLKRTILTNLIDTANKKDEYKQKGKVATDKGDKSRLKGLETATKLRMNGGYFGKMGQKGSFLEYPEGVLKVTMANQIEILMLIESMELEGFKVVSGNTDGIVTLYPKEKEDAFVRICKEWEVQVGNDVRGKLEYNEFAGLWQDSINSYIAKSADGSIKKKGRFMTEFELNKNKSMRIIPLALEAYFMQGIDPQEFIKSHKNIYDFCIAKKASGQMHYEEQSDSGEIKKHKKLVRYFVSTEGTVLYKRGFNHEGKPMNNHVNAPTDLGQPKVTYFNKYFKAEDYKIDYDHYILEVLERIDNLEKTRKAKSFVDSKGPVKQMSLF